MLSLLHILKITLPWTIIEDYYISNIYNKNRWSHNINILKRHVAFIWKLMNPVGSSQTSRQFYYRFFKELNLRNSFPMLSWKQKLIGFDLSKININSHGYSGFPSPLVLFQAAETKGFNLSRICPEWNFTSGKSATLFVAFIPGLVHCCLCKKQRCTTS